MCSRATQSLAKRHRILHQHKQNLLKEMVVWKDSYKAFYKNLYPTQMAPIVRLVCIARSSFVVVDVGICNICQIVIKHLVDSPLHL